MESSVILNFMKQAITLKSLATSIETLALITSRGFEEIKGTLSKHGEEIHALSLRVARLEEDAVIMRKDMENGFAEMRREFKKIWDCLLRMDYGPEIYNLKVRVMKAEKKLGT